MLTANDIKNLIQAFAPVFVMKDDFKQLLDESLESIRADIKEMKRNLIGVKHELDGIKQDVNGIKQELKSVKETLEEHSWRLDALATDSERIIVDVRWIRDETVLWHGRDKREIDVP